MNQYPEPEQLKEITEWSYERGFYPLIEYIRPLFEEYGRIDGPNRLGRVYMATGGWSGNEDIIEALADSEFWGLCWEKSARGGAHWFHIPRFARGSDYIEREK